MNYWQTDTDTGELIHPHPLKARLDPRTEGEFLIPRGGVVVSPPVPIKGFVEVWDGEGWTLVEDHRGKIGWVGGVPTVVDSFGPLPPGWSDDPQISEPEMLSVTPRQMRLALLSLGITPAMIESMLEGNDAALIEWEYASMIARGHPLVDQIGASLNKSPEEIDSLFFLAASL